MSATNSKRQRSPGEVIADRLRQANTKAQRGKTAGELIADAVRPHEANERRRTP